MNLDIVLMAPPQKTGDAGQKGSGEIVLGGDIRSSLQLMN